MQVLTGDVLMQKMDLHVISRVKLRQRQSIVGRILAGVSCMYAHAGLLCAGLVLSAQPIRAGTVADPLGFGGDSGKLAKFEFRLRDSIPVTSVAWSPDGRFIATASTQSNLVHIWDVRQRSIVKELRVATAGSAFHSLAWSPDGTLLVACGNSGLRVFAAGSWSVIEIDPSVSAGGLRATFSTDGQQLALLTRPRYLRVFSVPGWQVLKTVELRSDWGKGDAFEALAFLPGTHTLLLGGADYQRDTNLTAGVIWFFGENEIVPYRKVQAYRASDGKGRPVGTVISLVASPDGTRLATGTQTGAGSPGFVVTDSVHVIDTASGAIIGAPMDGDSSFGEEKALAYTPDGRFIIAGHEDDLTKAIHLIDAKSLRVADVVHGAGFVYDIAVSPASTQFAAGTNSQVLVWSMP
jgi:WD40 repeat protein